MVCFFNILTFTLPILSLTVCIIRMNRRKADFKFLYKYLEDDL